MKQNIKSRQVYLSEKNPERYLRIPEKSLFDVDMIIAEYSLTKIAILITLKNIKLNQSYAYIGDDFGVLNKFVRITFFTWSDYKKVTV